jgi:ATP-dependent DNA helicase HFM1/MER3
MRDATVKPHITPSMFPAPKPPEPDTVQQSNTSRRRAETVPPTRKPSTPSEDFGDDGLDDDELMKVAVGDTEFEHIDNFENPTDAIVRKNTAKNTIAKGKITIRPINTVIDHDDAEAVQLANGKWACNHRCKDKNACKHFCCKEGTDKPPKKTATAKRTASGEHHPQSTQKPATQKAKEKQTKLQLTASKRKTSSPIEELDLTQQEKKRKADYASNGPSDYRGLHQLHKTIQKKDPPSTIHSVMHKKPAYIYSRGGEHNLSFMDQDHAKCPGTSSDYGDMPLDELSSRFDRSALPAQEEDFTAMNDELDMNDSMDYSVAPPVVSWGSDTFGDDDSLLGDAMVGLADSQSLQQMSNITEDIMGPLEEALDKEYETGFLDEDFPVDMGFAGNDDDDWMPTKEVPSALPAITSTAPSQKPRAPFFDSTSSPKPPYSSFGSAKTMVTASELQELKQPNSSVQPSRQEPSDNAAEEEIDVLDLLDMFDDDPIKEKKPVPEAFKDLDPWLFEEFGDVVELVDE